VLMFFNGAREFRASLHASPTTCIALVLVASLLAAVLVVVSFTSIVLPAARSQLRRAGVGCALTATIVFVVGWLLRDERAAALAEQMTRVEARTQQLESSVAEGVATRAEIQDALVEVQALSRRVDEIGAGISVANASRLSNWIGTLENQFQGICEGLPNECEAQRIRSSAGLSLAWQAPVGPIVVNLAAPVRQAADGEAERMQFTFGTQF